MATTAVADPTRPARPAKTATRVVAALRYEHLFFSGMAVLMLATVLIGFAHTYYLAGIFSAPLPSLIIHLHAAAFSCWILLLVTQTSLVAAGRVDLHRRLGIAGFLLACVMVVLGVLAATDTLVREGGPSGRDPKFFYIVPLTDMLVFATLAWFAFRARSNAAAHKRLILVATISLMIAAVARWPVAIVHRNAPMAALFTYIFLLMLLAYDWWALGNPHRTTLWAGALLIVVQQIRIPIGLTVAWHSFASWVQVLAR